MDLIKHLHKQIDFSRNTFGEGYRCLAILNHIEKEIEEVKKNPHDLEEWIDIILLAFDGAWRSGNTPEEISVALKEKLEKNINRKWPDHNNFSNGQPIEHIKT